MSVVRLLGENVLLFLVGLGLLPVLGVAPNLDRLRRCWGVAYLAGIAAVGILGATLAVLAVPFPPAALAVVASVSLVLGGTRLDRKSDRERSTGQPVDRGLALTLALLLAGCGAAVFYAVVTKPLVEFDGWAIWGLKARAIAALGSSSGDVLGSAAYSFSHLEYPLLAPAVEALGLRAAGGYESRLVVIQCVLIGIAGMLALWALLRGAVRPLLVWTMLAAIALSPAVLAQLASGYADMPLAFLVAAGLVASARWLVEPHMSWLALATLLLAAGALTKDEGGLFAIAAYSGLLVAARQRWRPIVVAAACLGATVTPWRISIAVHHVSTASDFKLTRSVDPDWLRTHARSGPTALHDLVARSLEVSWYALLLPLGVTAICIAIWRGSRSLAYFAAVFAVLSFAGLSWIYVISDIDLHSYLARTDTRITASILVGCAALAPLLVHSATENDSTRGSVSRDSG